MMGATSSITAPLLLHFNWLYLISFLDLLATSLTVPLLGTYLRALNTSHTSIGIISAAYSTVQLFSGPIIGCWSDRYGRRQMLLFSLFVCASCYYYLGISTSLTTVFTLRCIIGMFKHTQMLTKAMVPDVIPYHVDQSNAYGILHATAAMGYVFGPLIAGHVFELKHGFAYLTRITCVLFVLNIVLVYCLLPGDIVENSNKRITNKKYNKNNSYSKSNVMNMFSDLVKINWIRFWDIFLLKFLVSISMSIFYINYPLMIEEEFKLSSKFIGYASSFQGLFSSLCSLFASQMWPSWLSNKSYCCKLMYSFFILSVSFFCVDFLSTNYITFVIILIPLCYSSSLLRIVTTKMLLQKSLPHQRGALIGAENTIGSVAHLTGPLISGFYKDMFDVSVHVPLLLSTVLATVGVVLSAVLHLIYLKKSS